MRFTIYSFLVLLIFTCQSENKQQQGILKELIVPTTESGEPNLHVNSTGEVFLSWIEYLKDATYALQYSKLKNERWSDPLTISSGDSWFVNWADFPSLTTYKGKGNFIAAHWLQMRDTGTYDYDVHISQSSDNGKTWRNSFIPHRDSIAAEHGFVSMLPLSEDRIFISWLDGRNTKMEQPNDHDDTHEGHGHHGVMTLRGASFDTLGKLYDEVELDDRVCDCCQTSAAMTGEGVIVAYRDRSEKEIRDISVVRQVNGQWTKPQIVFQDNWLISGCPVNGPVVKAEGSQVAVAWYTMKDEKGQVNVAFSNDNGKTFQLPIQIDEGNPLGRVDLLFLSKDDVLVLWMEEADDLAMIKAVLVNQQGINGNRFLLTPTSASRDSGFPKIVKTDNGLLLAWTNVADITKVKTAFWDLKSILPN